MKQTAAADRRGTQSLFCFFTCTSKKNYHRDRKNYQYLTENYPYDSLCLSLCYGKPPLLPTKATLMPRGIFPQTEIPRQRIGQKKIKTR